MSKIKLAIVGIGNCASSLVQGLHYYKDPAKKAIGLMHEYIGPYHVSDIEVVAAFDVNVTKVGKDLSEAIYAEPNCTQVFCQVPFLGVQVKQGVQLDGIAPHMLQVIDTVPAIVTQDQIVEELKASKAEIILSYLPVGSALASRAYAEIALKARCGFINAIPEFICSSQEWSDKFKAAGLPCAGDDIKSQVGATIVHRVLATLVADRGQTIDSTYQLNIGGNTDFLNMTDERRLTSKRISKTQAVTSIVEVKNNNVRIGPSDYVPHLKDNKVCYINLKGRQFGDIPFEMDLKLSVEDSPNSAGVMVDAIRCVKLALDTGFGGVLIGPSSYFFKSPPVQHPDSVAHHLVEAFIGEATAETV